MASERDTVVPGVAGKLEWLRDSVKAQPEGASDATWAWIEELSKRSGSDAEGADADLNELFRLGTAPTDLHGATEGMLVMTTTNPTFDAVVRAITSLWMKDHVDGKLAFDFKTYVEAGKEDPDIDVMVIDYADIEKNPKLIIRSVRDELVELVPSVYLGKILFKTDSGYTKIGYFALRIPR